MALTTCRECGAQVSTEAKACPSCGVKAPAKRTAEAKQSALTKKHTLSPRLKVLLGIMLVGLIANVFFSTRRPSQPSPGTSSQADYKPVDACFDQGANVAKVYLANIKTASEVGSSAQGMMDVACKDAVQKIGTRDCLGQCEAGFRYQTKRWVAGKP